MTAQVPSTVPYAEARKLNAYLIGDGLDIATITADVRLLADDLAQFRWCAPEYTEDLDSYSPDLRKNREPREFIPFLRDQLNNQATRLAEDSTTTTGNIRASAELQQAIANTTLQRVLLALAVITIIISVISLLRAKAPSPLVAMRRLFHVTQNVDRNDMRRVSRVTRSD